MKAKLTMAVLLLCGTQAFAGGLSGYYKVQSGTCADAGVLQGGTVEQITANASGLNQNLYMGSEGILENGSLYSPLFTANVGSVVNRPSADLIALGYTEVVQVVSSYNADSSSFVSLNYEYDVSVSDQDGANPQYLFSTTEFQLNGANINYHLSYNDGEVYNCVLVPTANPAP